MSIHGELAAYFRRWIRAEAGRRTLLPVSLVCLLTFTAALFGGFIQATGAADEVTAVNERHLFENHVAVAMHSLLASETVQLTWDDAMRAAGGQGEKLDVRWTDTYLGQFLASMVSADEMFLVTPRGPVLRAWRKGRPADPASFRPITGEATRALGRLAANTSLSGKPATFRHLQDTVWPYDQLGRPLARWSAGLVDHARRRLRPAPPHPQSRRDDQRAEPGPARAIWRRPAAQERAL